MIIISIIIAVLVGVVCFLYGKNTVGKQYNNIKENEQILEDIKKEYAANEQKLNQIIFEYDSKKEQVNSIEKEYQSKKKLISDAEKTAKKAHDNKVALLQEKYDKLVQEEQESYDKQHKYFEEEKLKIETELTQLQKHRAAAVAIASKEELLNKELDEYRLNISEQDIYDISILNNIKLQISKPRILSMLIWQTFYQPIAKIKFPIILGEKEVCGIYKITNLTNNKVYIGQAKKMKSRWSEHCKCGVGVDTPANNKLYQAMLTDGLYNFSFELLEECEPNLLDDREQYYIDMFNSVNYGYNSRRQK